jgi:hypothetical protein
MSEEIKVRPLINIVLAVFMSAVFSIVIVQSLGVAEYAMPLLLPIYLLLIVTVGFVGLMQVASLRMTQKAQYLTSDNLASSTQGQVRDDMTRVSAHGQRGFFMIPSHCPHCGNALDLERVGWSGSRTLTCPDCYQEIDVKVV